MLRITFLGTSGSAPTTERSMPAIALKYEKELLLWDIGECTQRQMMRYKVGYGSVNAIFVSHPHLDHYLGVFGLLETMNLMARPRHKIHIYSFEELGKRLQERYGFVEAHTLKKGVVYKGGGFEIEAFPVRHCAGAYGFVFRENDRIKFHEKKAHKLGLKGRMFTEIQKKGFVTIGKKKVKLEDVSWVKKGISAVYSGDTSPNEGLIKAAKDADILICEGTLDPSMKKEAEERLHCTMEDAAKIAKKAKAKKLVITHISPRYSDEDELEKFKKPVRKIFKNTVFAYDGMKLEVF
jgi:ribonuclease Z